ncbi:peroxisomal biogenesis factor 19-like [Haliotis cracherodii]|uniref:peroxisomal biogenesis factor 19-like n=1 Tax=Haliotis cracherodii TaxID=6455 RepID=UPI0039E89729
MADKGENVTPSGDENIAKETESKQSSSETKPDEDSELNDLLDSALEDFDKPKTDKPGVGQVLDGSDVDTSGPAPVAGAAAMPSPADIASMFGGVQGSDDPISEEVADEMANQFEEAMKAFMSQDPNMMQQIEKLADAAGSAGDSVEAQQEFAKTLGQTLTGMAENAETLQQQMSEEELSQAFTNMGVGGGGGGGAGPGGDMFPMMHGMMKMLLSKDVLYPSLKEISEKYPKWLEEHKDTESASSLDTYRRQHQLISSICVEFEAETPTDTEETKSQRFDKLMELMQQMQELGQPPKEIVGEMAPGLEFDDNGIPKLPGMTEQCVVM